MTSTPTTALPCRWRLPGVASSSPTCAAAGQPGFVIRRRRSGQQAALGQDLRHLIDALNLKGPILAGYDWGGRAACVVAALWPERVGRLVSINGYNIQNIAILGVHKRQRPNTALLGSMVLPHGSRFAFSDADYAILTIPISSMSSSNRTGTVMATRRVTRPAIPRSACRRSCCGRRIGAGPPPARRATLGISPAHTSAGCFPSPVISYRARR